MQIEMYQDRNGAWRWRGVDTNYRIICDSAEGYVNRNNLERAIDNVVNGFRGHIEVVSRERRTSVRGEGSNDAEQLDRGEVTVIAEYQGQGDEGHAEKASRDPNR